MSAMCAIEWTDTADAEQALEARGAVPAPQQAFVQPVVGCVVHAEPGKGGCHPADEARNAEARYAGHAPLTRITPRRTPSLRSIGRVIGSLPRKLNRRSGAWEELAQRCGYDRSSRSRASVSSSTS